MTSDRPVGVMLLLIAALALPAPAVAQPRRLLDPHLRVEWSVPELPPAMAKIVGYVHNDSTSVITDVRLHVVGLDAAGTATEESWGWVFGDIPAGGRAFFAVPLAAPAAAFTVTVTSFDVVSGESP